MIRVVVSIVLLLFIRVAIATQTDDLEFFEKRVRPVLVAHCYPCHSADAKKVKGGLKLDSRRDLLKGGENGPVIVPGNAESSPLIEAVRYKNPDLKMPPPKQGKLSDEQIADLVAWVNSGAACPDPTSITNKTNAQKHWAFQPVGAPSVPPVKDKKWMATPIDSFILAKLDELQPSPRADRRTLIRRATYDLTGLPPTPEEADSFTKDRSPNAYEKLIDRLLASPRYGERWGRYWLDVARFADTKGYVYSGREETKFVQSAAYRDWVIRAFNEDLPYDQFLKLQIAADQMEAGRNSLAAMGYLTMGRRFLGVVHDIIDDRIDVTMRGMQGLTVGCARCHDHKFDPIPTKDYYSLYGVFAGCYERTVALDAPSIPAKAYLEYETELKKREDKFTATFHDKCEEQAKRFRAKTTEYLHGVLNAEKFETEVFYSFVTADDVNPVVVRQWQAYLLSQAKQTHPVWGLWHSYVDVAKAKKPFSSVSVSTNKTNPLVTQAFKTNAPASLHDVADRYGKLLVAVDKKSMEGKTLSPDEEELRQVLVGADSPAVVPPGAIVDMEWYFDEPTRVALGGLQVQIDQWMIQSPGSPPHAVILEDRAVQKNPHVFKRGNPANKGDEVPRQFLEVLSGPNRKPFTKGSGRLELAEAIASTNNPLTARVMVNRIWFHHFGAGLVRTPSDFGTRSEPASHPELLDWLARYFMDNGWSMKKVHRLIMLSSVYQQRSDDPEDARTGQADPENRLLSRMNRQRLDFEAMRDSLLAVSGQIDLKLGGPSEELFKAPYSKRRSVYGFIDRQFLAGAYRVFDFANPDMHNPQRAETTVPQQALFLMNSPFVIEQSRALAARVGGSNKEKISQLYRIVFQREPTSKQLNAAVVFLSSAQSETTNSQSKTVPSAWQNGYGEFDESPKKLKSFTVLPHYTEDAWQGGPTLPDATLGWAQLTATGGHAGNDLQHAVIRRWVSPIDGTVAVQGKVVHERAAGEGIKAKIISSRHGLLKEWTLHNNSAEANLSSIEVKTGDTLDFYVSIAVTLNSNDFLWSPVIQAQGKEFLDANGYAREWNAKREFGGTPS
ncbi:MAG: PSD1 and planctomycete cytochrome C domain-containing protein, partial [Limisphaerales bacterium]